MSETAEATKPEIVVFPADRVVPMRLWGKDHWSMLGYVEAEMVESGMFQVGFDARIRQNRRNVRVMAQECPRPKRAKPTSLGQYGGWDEKYRTRLNDGSEAANHDDWCCVQDMAAEGLFASTHKTPRPIAQEDVEPKVKLRLSEKGQRLAAALRQHKATGGQFGNFRADPSFFSPEPAPPDQVAA